MKKLEATLIKRLLRISWQGFSHIVELSYILSLFFTLGHLEFWSTLALEQERKESRKNEEASKEEQESSSYNNIICRYLFACVFSLLDLSCMVFHVVSCCLGMGFSRCDSVLNLAFPFRDSHCVVEFSCFGLAALPNGFEAE